MEQLLNVCDDSQLSTPQVASLTRTHLPWCAHLRHTAAAALETPSASFPLPAVPQPAHYAVAAAGYPPAHPGATGSPGTTAAPEPAAFVSLTPLCSGGWPKPASPRWAHSVSTRLWQGVFGNR